MIRRHRIKAERPMREGMRSPRRRVVVVQVDGNSIVEANRLTSVATRGAVSSSRATSLGSVRSISSSRATSVSVEGPSEITSTVETGLLIRGTIRSAQATTVAFRGPVQATRTTSIALKKTVASFQGSNVDDDPIGTTSVATRLGVRTVESERASSVAFRGTVSSSRDTSAAVKQGVSSTRSTSVQVVGPAEILSEVATSVAVKQGVSSTRSTTFFIKSKMGPTRPVSRIKLRAPKRVRLDFRM